MVIYEPRGKHPEGKLFKAITISKWPGNRFCFLVITCLKSWMIIEHIPFEKVTGYSVTSQANDVQLELPRLTVQKDLDESFRAVAVIDLSGRPTNIDFPESHLMQPLIMKGILKFNLWPRGGSIRAWLGTLVRNIRHDRPETLNIQTAQSVPQAH